MYANKEYIKKCVPRLGGQLPTSFSTYKLLRTNPSLGAVVHVDALEPHEAPALTKNSLWRFFGQDRSPMGPPESSLIPGAEWPYYFAAGW